jgi:hypothetical protein
MAEGVYALAAATCLVCAVLLARAYARTRQRLLLWSAVCFGGLVLNNVFTILDVFLFPDVSLHLIRSAIGFASIAVLAFGLVGESP